MGGLASLVGGLVGGLACPLVGGRAARWPVCGFVGWLTASWGILGLLGGLARRWVGWAFVGGGLFRWWAGRRPARRQLTGGWERRGSCGLRAACRVGPRFGGGRSGGRPPAVGGPLVRATGEVPHTRILIFYSNL